MLARVADQNASRHELPSLKPDIRLFGNIDEDMVRRFLERSESLDGEVPLVVELCTMGGDAESARRLAQEIHMLDAAREVFLLGKSYVYSAGVTVMAAFPRTHRFVTPDTMLLIHERRVDRTVKLAGALRSALADVKDLLAELEVGERLERRGFERLAAGSKLSVQDLLARVLERDWYLDAKEALELGLIAGIVG